MKWIALFLIPLVSSCGTVVVDTPNPVPPQTLLRECPHPTNDPETMRELVEMVLDYTAALDRCNADKAAIRSFYDALDQGAPER